MGNWGWLQDVLCTRIGAQGTVGTGARLGQGLEQPWQAQRAWHCTCVAQAVNRGSYLCIYTPLFSTLPFLRQCTQFLPSRPAVVSHHHTYSDDHTRRPFGLPAAWHGFQFCFEKGNEPKPVRGAQNQKQVCGPGSTARILCDCLCFYSCWHGDRNLYKPVPPPSSWSRLMIFTQRSDPSNRIPLLGPMPIQNTKL